MKDWKLFEKANKYMKAFFCGGASLDTIEKFSRELGVQLPDSYIRFLQEFGAGGLGFFNLMGIEDEDFSSMVIETQKYRESVNLPHAYVVVSYRSAPGFEYITCLDTSRMKDNECPVVKFDLLTNMTMEYQPTFDDAFNDGIMDVYNVRIVPRLSAEPSTTEFPAGLGYKGCWMTVIGSNQKSIVNTLSLNNTLKIDYMKGLEEVKSTPGKVMVTADYDNRNYVLFYGGDFMFEESFILKVCGDLPEIYGFITHRVSEAHGFFKVKNGEIQRVYYRDDERILSVGEPTPEEKKNKAKFPASIEEAKDKKTKWTKFDEKMILKLAENSSSVQVDSYPYEEVIIGDL